MAKKKLWAMAMVCVFGVGTTLFLLYPFGMGDKEESLHFFAMDTFMEIRAWGVSPKELKGCEALVKDLEGRWSVTRPSSYVYRLNHQGEAEVDKDTLRLIQFGTTMGNLTQGALDISIYPLVKAWGFTEKNPRVPTKEELQRALSRVDYSRIRIRKNRVTLAPGMKIDLGSLAKGYAGDRVVEFLHSQGVSSALCNLGGNVQCLGSRPQGGPWRLAIQAPFQEEYLGVLEVVNKGVITSGGYERYFKDAQGNLHWHILDRATGKSARSGLVSMTVVTEKGLWGDGLSTALFVMGLEKARAFWKDREDFDFIALTESGDIVLSSGLEHSFTPLGAYKKAPLKVVRR